MALHLIAFIYLVLVTFYMKAQNLDQLRDSVTLEEQRAFIKINVLLDTSPRVVLAQLQTAPPNTGLQQSAVYKWYGDSGFLNKIIAIDETWLKSYDPRDSEAESEWLLPGQKP